MTRPSNKLNKQLNKGNDGLGNNKKRQAVANDIGKLVDAHNALARITQEKIDEINNHLEEISIVLQSISQIIGVEKVAEGAKAFRIKMAEDEVVKQAANVAKFYEEGKLAKVDAVNEGCLVVTTVKKADGTQTYPTKSYLPLVYYKPEIQEILKGKKVGDVLPMPTEGGTIEVLEIYIEVQKDKPDFTSPATPPGELAITGTYPVVDAEVVEKN
jgi:hypothetical protein